MIMRDYHLRKSTDLKVPSGRISESDEKLNFINKVHKNKISFGRIPAIVVLVT